MANWSQNQPLGGKLAPMSNTRWRFVKSSFQTCYQVVHYYQIIPPGGFLVPNFPTSAASIVQISWKWDDDDDLNHVKDREHALAVKNQTQNQKWFLVFWFLNYLIL